MTLTCVTPPTDEPVTVDELKAHLLGVSEAQSDDDLKLKLYTARTYVEHGGTLPAAEQRALLTSTWRLRLKQWPRFEYIELPLGNLQSVSGIRYRMAGGTWATMPTDDYHIERVYTPASESVDGDGQTDARSGRIYLNYAKIWPVAILDYGEPIEITFVCGWDSPESVPYPLKAAILLGAANLYNYREGGMSDEDLMKSGKSRMPADPNSVTRTIDMLIAPYMITRF